MKIAFLLLKTLLKFSPILLKKLQYGVCKEQDAMKTCNMLHVINDKNHTEQNSW